MRIDSRISNVLLRTEQIQNRNYEKTVAEAKNVKKNEVIQKTATEKHLKSSETKTERKDIVTPEIMGDKHFKIYSKDGKVAENNVNKVFKLDIRV